MGTLHLLWWWLLQAMFKLQHDTSASKCLERACPTRVRAFVVIQYCTLYFVYTRYLSNKGTCRYLCEIRFAQRDYDFRKDNKSHVLDDNMILTTVPERKWLSSIVAF